MAQIASQYLETFLEYQYSDAKQLHDPTCAQYYISDALAIINWMTSNPDVAIRVAQHPKLLHDTIEKLLNPNIEKDMKACSRSSGSAYESDFGSMLQFVSTILLRQDHLQNPAHPRIEELVPKLKAWKRKYTGTFIAKVSDQIAKPDSLDLAAVKISQQAMLFCGYIRCGVRDDLRYCSTEYQRKDWGSHKKICCKGLPQVEAGTTSEQQQVS